MVSFLSASHRAGPLRPRGDHLSRHLLPLFLWERPEDCSVGGNPPPVPHLDFSLFLGQYLRHVPILRTARIPKKLLQRRGWAHKGSTDYTEQCRGAALLPFHSNCNTPNTCTRSSQPERPPITVSAGTVVNQEDMLSDGQCTARSWVSEMTGLLFISFLFLSTQSIVPLLYLL